MKVFGGAPDEYYESDMADFPLPVRMLYAIALAVVFAFTKIMWRWTMADEGHLQPSGDTGRVIICNHTSMAEVPALVAYLWSKGHRVRPIFKSEFNGNGLVRWAFARAGGIPVERGTADMKSLRRAQHALQRGEDILIFPEGTRVRSDDQEVQVHGGFALIAQMGKAAIAPVGVCGFRDVTPEGKKLMRPVTCWMKAGAPVSFDDAPVELKRKERVQWIEDEAVRRMYALRDDLRREHPGRR